MEGRKVVTKGNGLDGPSVNCSLCMEGCYVPLSETPVCPFVVHVPFVVPMPLFTNFENSPFDRIQFLTTIVSFLSFTGDRKGLCRKGSVGIDR